MGHTQSHMLGYLVSLAKELIPYPKRGGGRKEGGIAPRGRISSTHEHQPQEEEFYFISSWSSRSDWLKKLKVWE